MLYRLAGHLVAGVLLGAAILGAGARLFMRLLTYWDGRQPGFSWGGTIEVVAYGAIVGGVSAIFFALAGRPLLWCPMRVALVWGGLTYGATILTLPAHIAQSAAPFAVILGWVHVGFGLIFFLFALALVRVSRRYWP